MLADNLARPEHSFLHMMNDEVVDKILHSVSVTSDNVDVQLDHGNARNEVNFYLLCAVCIFPFPKISAIIIHILHVVRI